MKRRKDDPARRQAMRAIEWLLEITQSRSYAQLVEDSGGLSSAAWQLAHAQCMTRGLATPVPTRLEVRSAARRLAEHLGIDRVPSSTELRADCEARGLLVL